jgi:hypothetical protein
MIMDLPMGRKVAGKDFPRGAQWAQSSRSTLRTSRSLYGGSPFSVIPTTLAYDLLALVRGVANALGK